MPTSPTVKKQMKMHANVPLKYKHKFTKPAEIASATFGFQWLPSLESFAAHGALPGALLFWEVNLMNLFTLPCTHIHLLFFIAVELIFRSNFSDCHRKKKKKKTHKQQPSYEALHFFQISAEAFNSAKARAGWHSREPLCRAHGDHVGHWP